MLHHSLAITPSEIAELQGSYKKLVEQIEKRSSSQPEEIREIERVMQRILMNQEGLQSFWQQVEGSPFERHYLHLTHTDKEVCNLPWQLAIDGIQYPFVYISKGLEGSTFSNNHQPHAAPLKILVMIASPDDLNVHNRLSYEEEEEAILNALAPLWQQGQVRVDFTDYGSLQSMQQHLRQQHYHILYVSGHGVYKNNTGYLQLENQDTFETEQVTASEFAAAVTSTKAYIPTLVILNSCQTAKGNISDGFPGVADELIRAGIPAVIAMAFSISDQFATIFAAHLFNGLADKDDLPAAFNEALKAMKDEEQQLLVRKRQSGYPSQWLIPQLYCNTNKKEIADWDTIEEIQQLPSEKITGTGRLGLLNPHSNYQFIGRRRESARIFNRLLKNEPVLLRGQGGIGKTSLVEHLTKRLVSHDVHFRCFVFNELNTGIDSMIDTLEDYLNKHDPTAIIEASKLAKAIDKLIFLLKKVTSLCRIVWVFDNMESCQQKPGGPLTEMHIEWMNFIKVHLLNKFPVIFTSRYPIVEMVGIYDCSLNQVTFVDYYRKCFQLSIGKMRQLHEVARILYNGLGGNYRLLEVFDEIYRRENNDAASIIQQLTNAGTTADNWQSKLTGKIYGELEDSSKKLVFSKLLDLLNEDELFTLQFLSKFLRPVLQDALKDQDPVMEFLPLLKRLQDLTLIEEQPVVKPGNISLHYYYVTPLVRDWLDSLHLPPILFSHSLAGYYLEDKNKQTGENYYEDLKEAFRHFGIARSIISVNSLGIKLVKHYDDRSLFHQALQIALTVESIAGNETYASIYSRLGSIYRIFGKYKLAIEYYNKSLTDKIKQRCLQNDKDAIDHKAAAIGNIGQVYKDMGNYELALRNWEESLRLYKSTENYKNQNHILINVSSIYASQANTHKVLDLLEEVRKVNIRLGQTPVDERMMNITAVLARNLGEYNDALRCLSEALSMLQKKGKIHGQNTILSNIGDIHLKLGNYDEALEYFNKSLSLAKMMGDVSSEIATLNSMGNINYTRHNYNEAWEIWQLCLERQQRLGDKAGECITYSNLAQVCTARGEFEKSLQLLNRTLQMNASLKHEDIDANVFNSIGKIYSDQGNYEKALEYLKKSLSISNAIDNRKAAALALHNIAGISWKQEEFEEFYEYELKAFKTFEDLQDARGIYNAGRFLATYLLALGDADSINEGLSYLQKSYEIGRRARFPDTDGMARILKKYS